MTTTYLYEHMIRVTTHHYVCRIWRAADYGRTMSNEQVADLAYKLMFSDITINEMVSELIQLELVNSVEIIERDSGNGMCVHKDWP